MPDTGSSSKQKMQHQLDLLLLKTLATLLPTYFELACSYAYPGEQACSRHFALMRALSNSSKSLAFQLLGRFQDKPQKARKRPK